MNVALWIAQAALAFAFLMAGGAKLTQPREALVPQMPFVEDFSLETIRLIGLLEVLGAIGVVMPWLIGLLPWLTSWAAVGLSLTMVGAMITHLRRRELGFLAANTVLFALSVFVAWGRWPS